MVRFIHKYMLRGISIYIEQYTAVAHFKFESYSTGSQNIGNNIEQIPIQNSDEQYVLQRQTHLKRHYLAFVQNSVICSHLSNDFMQNIYQSAADISISKRMIRVECRSIVRIFLIQQSNQSDCHLIRQVSNIHLDT